MGRQWRKSELLVEPAVRTKRRERGRLAQTYIVLQATRTSGFPELSADLRRDCLCPPALGACRGDRRASGPVKGRRPAAPEARPELQKGHALSLLMRAPCGQLKSLRLMASSEASSYEVRIRMRAGLSGTTQTYVTTCSRKSVPRVPRTVRWRCRHY